MVHTSLSYSNRDRRYVIKMVLYATSLIHPTTDHIRTNMMP